MKKIIYVMLGIMAIVVIACQNDPIFPDPGFEIGDQRVEVRRDTADAYTIKTKMNVPNGVKSIELLEATNFSVINTIHNYDGQKYFDFSYPVDLRSFDQDTVLNYIIKVTDKDLRSFNQGIRISVKRKSYPEIKLVGGTNLAVVAPSYYVKGLVSCGLNTISSIKIAFEGTEQYSYTPPTPVKELPLKKIVLLGNLLPNRDYHITIIIKDDKGQESTTTITVRKGSELKKPRRIVYRNYNNTIVNMDLTYDQTTGNMTRLDYIFTNGSGTTYRHDFTYNSLNMVSKMVYTNITSAGTISDLRVFYNYVAGTKKVFNIENQRVTYSSGTATEYAKTIEYKTFTYNANNAVQSFVKAQTVSQIYYSDPFGLGEQIFGEYWQSTSYQVSLDKNRQHRVDYDPILIPTFIEGFPPFAEGNSVLFPIFNDLLWSKYVMTSTVHTSLLYTSTLTYLDEPTYTYETDNEGTLTSITKIYKGGNAKGKTETYTFIYD